MTFPSSPAPAAANPRPLWIFFLLVGIGIAANYLTIGILNGELVFGSIFTMLALQIFGWGKGVAAGLPIAAAIFLRWQHPWAMILMVLEVAVTGYLLHRRRFSLLAADALYWVVAGLPLGYLCYHFLGGFAASDTYFVLTKNALNGIANAMLARLLFTLYALRRNPSSTLTFQEIITNLLALFTLSTAFIILAVSSRNDMDDTDRHIRQGLSREGEQIAENLANWVEERKLNVAHLAEMAQTLPLEQLQTGLDQVRAMTPNFLRLGLQNAAGIVTAFSPPVDELGRPNVGKSFADRAYRQTLRQHLQPMLSEVLPSRFGRSAPVAIMLAPVLRDGAYGGAMAGVLNLERLGQLLERGTEQRDSHYTLVDKNGRVIHTNRQNLKPLDTYAFCAGKRTQLAEGIFRHIPETPAGVLPWDLWGKTHYCYERVIGNLSEWKLVLEQPVAPFQKTLFDRYTRQFSLIFCLFFVILALAEFLSRRIMATSRMLTGITEDLPAKLASGDAIAWPDSIIHETRSLISHFREMAALLTQQFNDIRRMNETLEDQVALRTEDLRKSEAQLAEAMDMARLGHWEYDAIDDIFLFNDRFYSIFGTSVKEVGGYALSSAAYAERFVHPEDRRVVAEELRAAKETADPRLHRQLEHRCLKADGTIGHISVRFSVIKDARGRTIGTYGVNQDITERKRVEEALRESEHRFRSLVENVNDIIFSLTPNGIFTYVSPNWLAMLGEPADKAVGRSFRDYVHPEDVPLCVEFFRQVLAFPEKQKSVEYRIRHQDGTWLWHTSSGSPLRNEAGEVSSYVGVARDVTEKKKMQEFLIQSEKVISLGVMAAGMAHEINNPLGIISQGVQNILRRTSESLPANLAAAKKHGVPFDGLKNYLDERNVFRSLAAIQDAVARSALIVANLLEFSRKTDVSATPHDIGQILDKTVQLAATDYDLKKKYDFRNIRIVTDYTLKEPVPCLATELEQVFLNLLRNSAQSLTEIQRENPVIRLRTRAENRWAVIEVEDNGSGIAPALRKHIFDPFFTTKQVGEGTGLGLAVSFHIIVQRHQGEMLVESAEGAWTRFIIRLPMVRPKPDTTSSE